MAWETRSNGNYYYRYVRTGKRVQKIYVGTGARAQAMARQDAQARAARAADREAAEALSLKLAPFEQLAEEADAEIHQLLKSVLQAAGFHWHRGEWRKKRHGNPDTNNPAGSEPGSVTDPRIGEVELGGG
jgi:hypothetical protein